MSTSHILALVKGQTSIDCKNVTTIRFVKIYDFEKCIKTISQVPQKIHMSSNYIVALVNSYTTFDHKNVTIVDHNRSDSAQLKNNHS